LFARFGADVFAFCWMALISVFFLLWIWYGFLCFLLDGIDLYVFVVAFALISVFVGRFGVEFFAFCWMTLFSVFFFVF